MSTLTRGKFDALYLWGRERLEVEASADRSKYRTTSQLNHDGHLLNGNFLWHAGPVLDGVLVFKDTRQMVPFSDVASTVLLVEHDEVEQGRIGVMITPHVRLEATGSRNNDDSPRVGQPNLALRERYREVTLGYQGPSGFAAGLELADLQGRFDNVTIGTPPTYRQTRAQGTMTYSVAGLYSFDGAIGYSRRATADGTNLAGLTGSVKFKRSLTGKTEISIDLGRAIYTYISATGPTLETRGGATVYWHATPKIDVHTGWTTTHSDFRAAGGVFASISGRIDRHAVSDFAVDYRARPWLLLHAYVTLQDRVSTLPQYAFTSSTVGASIAYELR
jgi:hypothetical protein